MTPTADLAEANRQLKRLHEELAAKAEELSAKSAELAAKEQEIEQQREALDEREARIKELIEQIAYMKRQLFGRRRESIDPAQLALFEDLKIELSSLTGAEVEEAPEKPKKKRGHGRALFAADLPRETITLDLPEEERTCSCGEELKSIGIDVTERGHIIPARMCVKRYERHKYACPKGHTVKVAPLPDGVVDRGKYEASVYAFVATSKYADHVPLNRIEGIMKRYGAHLPRQTMWDLMVRLDELVAQPVLKQMHAELLEEKALQADETFIPFQREGEKGTKQGALWSWRNVRGSPVQKVVADFRMNRSAEGPTRFLSDWAGLLLTDGFDGVNPVAVKNGITRAGCMAHARRKFNDALESGDKRAAGPLRSMQDLFAIEGDITAKATDEDLGLEDLAALRLKVREERSKAILADLFEQAFTLDADPAVSRGSRLQKAVTYLINQKAPLLAHLEHGEIPIHNNDTERDLRHVVVGKKNWQMFGAKRGGEVAGRLYSLAISCKLNGIDVQSYLEDVLGLISTETDVAALTPWAWEARRRAAAPDPAN